MSEAKATQYRLYDGIHCGGFVTLNDAYYFDGVNVYARPRDDKGNTLYHVMHWLAKHTPDKDTLKKESDIAGAWFREVSLKIASGMEPKDAVRNLPLLMCKIRYSMHHALFRAGLSITHSPNQ